MCRQYLTLANLHRAQSRALRPFRAYLKVCAEPPIPPN
jgi:hypothetical protein